MRNKIIFKLKSRRQNAEVLVLEKIPIPTEKLKNSEPDLPTKDKLIIELVLAAARTRPTTL